MITDAAYAPLLINSVRDGFLGNNTSTNAVCSGAPVVAKAFSRVAPPYAAVLICNANITNSMHACPAACLCATRGARWA